MPKNRKKVHNYNDDTTIQGDEELDKEIEELEKRVEGKENELFEVKRNALKRKLKVNNKVRGKFVRNEKIMLKTTQEHNEQALQCLIMLCGLEVKSYVEDDHCCIVYHMQHDSKYSEQHGIKINMEKGQKKVERTSFPPGFNLEGVLAQYDNIMSADCHIAIRRGLVAYHDRQEQYNSLQESTSTLVSLFKLRDSSQIEISTRAFLLADKTRKPIQIELTLNYKIYDVRPTKFTLPDLDILDEILDEFEDKCLVFNTRPLKDAFEYLFLKKKGPFQCFTSDITFNESPKGRSTRQRPLESSG